MTAVCGDTKDQAPDKAAAKAMKFLLPWLNLSFLWIQMFVSATWTFC